MSAFWTFLNKRPRRPKKTALESVRPKKKEEALAWARRYYPDDHFHDTAARFVIVLESQINVPIRQFLPQTRFLEDLGMDHLEPVEVIMAFEEEFEVQEIANADIEKKATVDHLIRCLREIRRGKAQEP